MDARFNSRSNNNNNNPSFSEEDDTDIAEENIAESPPSAIFNIDSFVTSTSSPKRSRRAIKKRVVQIPIKDVDGSRLKGESKTPPSDSWAWRKYGQKPIKGSPYPRGYYRCSSSKGCPARKQVERSRMDPTMLVVTYSYEHNHPWSASKKNHHHRNSNVNSASATNKLNIKSEHDIQTDPEPEPDSEEKFAGPSDDSLIATADEYGWFGEMEFAGTTSSVVWESRMYTGDDADVGSVLFPMGEEDESLFAELGELPECSVIFGRGLMEREDDRRRRCGTTRGGAGLFGTFLEERD